MVNLFAFRATQPFSMKLAQDPIGPENDRWIATMAETAARTVVMWGKHGTFLDRDKAVLPMLVNPHCLGLNTDDTPTHLLYTNRRQRPFRYQGRDRTW